LGYESSRAAEQLRKHAMGRARKVMSMMMHGALASGVEGWRLNALRGRHTQEQQAATKKWKQQRQEATLAHAKSCITQVIQGHQAASMGRLVDVWRVNRVKDRAARVTRAAQSQTRAAMQSVMEARLQQRAMQSMAACVRRLGHALQRNLLFSWRVRTAAECSGPPSGERQEVHLSPQTDEVEATLEAERRQVEKLKGELAEERKKLQEMQKIQVSDSGNDIEATEGQGVQ